MAYKDIGSRSLQTDVACNVSCFGRFRKISRRPLFWLPRLVEDLLSIALGERTGGCVRRGSGDLWETVSEVALVRKYDPVRGARNTADKSAEVRSFYSELSKMGEIWPTCGCQRDSAKLAEWEHQSQLLANQSSRLTFPQPMRSTEVSPVPVPVPLLVPTSLI